MDPNDPWLRCLRDAEERGGGPVEWMKLTDEQRNAIIAYEALGMIARGEAGEHGRSFANRIVHAMGKDGLLYKR